MGIKRAIQKFSRRREEKLKKKAFEKFLRTLGDKEEFKKLKAALDTAFDGASFQVESMQYYNPLSQSANDDLNAEDREVMIARCREAYNNSLYGKAAINRMIDGAVGTSGLSAKSNIDNETIGLSEEEAATLQRFFNQKWKRWTRAKNCDIAGQDCFAKILKKVSLGKYVDGDILVNTISQKFSPKEEFSLKIQLIEGERLSNPFQVPDREATETENGLSQGVEVNYFGRHIKYHIRGAHPGDTVNIKSVYTWQELPVYGEKSGRKRVFFVAPFGRVGQTRGVPCLAVGLDKLKGIKAHSRHELVGAALQAIYTVIVKNISPSEDTLHNNNNNLQKNLLGTVNSKRNVQLGAGLITYLAQNEDVIFADPTRPNANFSDFQDAQLKELAAGYGIPYEYLVLIFNSSYTAARASFLQVKQKSDSDRFDLINDFCLDLWELFILEILEDHEIPEEIEDLIDWDEVFDNDDYFFAISGVTFSGSALGSIDEVKDVQAAGLKIDKGLSDFDTEIRKIHGDSDFETVNSRLAEQLKYRREHGIAELQTPGVKNASVPIPSTEDVINQLEEGEGENGE